LYSSSPARPDSGSPYRPVHHAPRENV